jgi:DNA-binding NarL/FixJ family response regulator
MRVRVVDPDILSSTRVRDQIRRAGWTLAANDEPADAAVVNLARVDAASAIAATRAGSPGAAVVGFCGHADHGRRSTAMAAGYDAVIPHGEAMNRVAQAIAGVARKEQRA